MKIITICGSLRSRSLNRALLNALPGLAPSGVTFEDAAIGELPLYNDDRKDDLAVASFRSQVSGADALLIGSPEYNYGIPGPLKNAIDWGSRPAYQSPFYMKPVGLLGAAGGLVGTARSQGQLKQVLLGMASQVFPFPEVLVGQSAKKFSDELTLVDDDTKQLLTRFLAAFAAWAEKVR